MRPRRKQTTAVLFALLLLIMTVGVTFAGTADTRTVGANEVVNGDVTVFNDDLEIERGATINGDVVVLNGDAVIAGTINGDLVLFRGDLTLESGAAITGDCVLLSGEQSGVGDIGVNCVSVGGLPALAVPDKPATPDFPVIPAVPELGRGERSTQSTIGSALTAFGNVLVISVLALLMAVLAPDHLRRVADAAREKPVASGTVGILTVIAVPALMVLLAIVSALLIIVCIGLLGIPLLLLLAIGFVAAILIGWIAVGKLLGDRLMELFRRPDTSLVLRTVLGTVVLTVVMAALNTFAVGEWIAGIMTVVVGAIGLGAVTLTKFGRKPYPRMVQPDPDKMQDVLNTMPPDAESAPSTD